MPIDANELVPSIYALLSQPWPAGIASPAEIAAGAVIVNYGLTAGSVYRYGTNTTPGTTDMTAAIQTAINVAAISQSHGLTTAVILEADVHLISSSLLMKSYVQLLGSYGETTDQGALPGNSGTELLWGGPATNVSFTANIAGATSGTLTAPIANGQYKGFTFYNSTNPTVTAEQRWVTVTGGVNCTWTTALQTGTITTGITGAGVMVSCFDARLFRIDGLVINGNNVPGTIPLLLDSDNTPSSTENDIRAISLRNFSIGIQWGTSGIANGAYAVGCRIAIFTMWSAIPNSIGMIVNSSNAGQVSTIESGGIQTDLMGIDVKVCNQLQIQRVFTGGPVTLTGIRFSVGIDMLVEGCDFENHGPVGGLISASSNSILVIPPVESYPTTQCVLTLRQNKFNNPVVVTPGVGNGVRILDLGNSWGECNTTNPPSPPAYIPATGQCLSGLNYVTALSPGALSQSTYGWQNSAFVQLMRLTPDGGITLTGSFSGYTDELAGLSTASGGLMAISSALAGAALMLFDFRATGNTGSWLWRNGSGAGTTRMGLSASGQLSLPQLPGTTSYANDAAAAAGGVAVGQLYRNASVVQVRVT